MSLKDSSLTTLAKVKTYLDVHTDNEDTLLELLIDGASGFISSFCDRTFKYVEYVEVLRGKGSDTLFLGEYPVIGSVTLEENTSGDATDDWNTINSDRYFTFNDEGYLEGVDFTFSRRPRGYRATYGAGFRVQGATVTGEHVALPDDLELACMRLVAALYNQRKSEGTQRQNLGDYSVDFAKIIESDPFLKETLGRYRRAIL